MSQQSTTSMAEGEHDPDYRLPRTVIPERYELRIAPDLEGSVFSGQEAIHVTVLQPVDEIQLNLIDLRVRAVSFTDALGVEHVPTWHTDPEKERLVLRFAAPLPAGKAKLSLAFMGNLSDKLFGFYRSTYESKSGERRTLAATQFEPTDARRAFPCFDEPDLKAVFAVTLTVDEGLVALSNSPVREERRLPDGRKEVVFADTIKMSTYLVAFVVGELTATSPVQAGKTPVRIWCLPGQEHLAVFAQRIAVFSLNFFESYYGIAYPGEKLDLIAIPDFAFGAMENLGAVIFRQSALLLDESAATYTELMRVADIVAHELAHMWFGDLTTMRWWNGIWLNEAFATFMQVMAVDAWKPEWRRWETFGASRLAAQTVDGLKTTRPIEFPVRAPAESMGMFDVLTYEKGASVLRMLEQYLGADVFMKGVRSYLEKHQYANTETTDLWDALEEASGEPVRTLMDSWIFQPGYPLVSVEAGADDCQLILRQERFFYDQTGHDPAEAPQLFHIPIILRPLSEDQVDISSSTSVETERCLLVEPGVRLNLPYPVKAVVANAGGHGFYRVKTAASLTEPLLAAADSALTAIERFNLVSDSWALSLSGHSPLHSYFSLLQNFLDETNENVWSAIIGSLQYLWRTVGQEHREDFSHYVRQLLTPAFQDICRVPPENLTLSELDLRAMLFAALGTIGCELATLENAESIYEQHRNEGVAIEPNLMASVVTVLAWSGDEARYEEFVAAFKSAATPQEEERYLYALAGFTLDDLLSRTLTMTLNGEVRTQNAPFLLRAVMLNVYGREMAWRFMKDNWEKIAGTYPANLIPRMCEGVTALCDPDFERDVREFFAATPLRHGQRTVEQHIERLHVAVEFKRRERESFFACFGA